MKMPSTGNTPSLWQSLTARRRSLAIGTAWGGIAIDLDGDGIKEILPYVVYSGHGGGIIVVPLENGLHKASQRDATLGRKTTPPNVRIPEGCDLGSVGCHNLLYAFFYRAMHPSGMQNADCIQVERLYIQIIKFAISSRNFRVSPPFSGLRSSATSISQAFPILWGNTP